MRTVLAAALALTVAGLPAQGGQSQAQDAAAIDAAKKAYDAIVADMKAADARYRAEIGAIQKTEEYKTALARFREDRDQEALAALRQMTGKVARPDRAAYLERFQEGAEKFAGTDGAVPFLTWIATSSGNKDAAIEAIDTLVITHVNSPKLIDFAEKLGYTRRLLGEERFADVCATLVEESKNDMVRAWAMYWPASMKLSDRNASEADKAEAQKVIDKVVELVPGTLLADRANAPRFVEERLQIGMVAPDIEGEDIDGVSFKLSDYRGKVVVIDFWGDW